MKNSSSKPKLVVFGLLVIALGVILILDNMRILPPFWSNIFLSWPMLILAIGFINVFGRSGRLLGIIIMAIGLFFLLPKITVLPSGLVHTYWPLIIVIVGILITYYSFRGFRRIGHTRQSKMDEYIDDVFIFGGGERVISSDRFNGGKSVNIFGGSTYDLTGAQMDEGTHVLDVTCIFGGVEIIVPGEWNIKVEVSAVLGGFEDNRKASGKPVDPNKTLIIKGATIFGGGEIKSY